MARKEAEKEKKGGGWFYLLAGALLTLAYLVARDGDVSSLLRELPFNADIGRRGEIDGGISPDAVPPSDESAVQAQDILVGRIVRVADGDTVTLLDSSRREHRIRLANIDAPERGQPFADVARRTLSELCYHRDVSVQIKEIDQYGRQVGWLRCDGINVNHRLVQDGLAWHYRRHSKSIELDALELEARSQRRGLWQDANPIPPWEWRRQHRAR